MAHTFLPLIAGTMFSERDLEAAAARVLGGEKISAVVATSTVSRSTLKRRLQEIKSGKQRERRRPGPKPILPAECEADLVTWVAAMQRAKLPVEPWEVIETANELKCSIRGSRRSSTDLTYGWYTRFMERHPELCVRASEPLARARHGVDLAAFRELFVSMAKDIIELKLDASRVYNMDETSFVSKHQGKGVVAVRGSTSVWTKVPETAFHLSIVASVSAAGHAIPPLFVMPGTRVRRTSLDGCVIDGSGVITAEKGFVNGKIFELWIDHFVDNLPTSVPRPVLLVCDGCSSHLGSAAALRCVERGVKILFLPPNATHLLQPLDVAVFRGFKREVARQLRRLLRGSSQHSLSRKEAIAVASAAYKTKIVGDPVASTNGFRCCGLFPPSLPAMIARGNKSSAGGVTRSELGKANWLHVRDEARATILSLPPSPIRKRGSRKTVDAADRVVTRADLLVSPPRKRKRGADQHALEHENKRQQHRENEHLLK